MSSSPFRSVVAPFLLLFFSAGSGSSMQGFPPTGAESPPFSGSEVNAVPAGIIVPQPSPEADSEEGNPVVLRIINQRSKPIYLQGFRQNEERIQVYLYHRDGKRGWKPFFDFLPCDLPICRRLRAPQKQCPKPIPFVVLLGPAGSADAIKEVPWDGHLYQRNEATQEDRQHRYCYTGWTPRSGRMRVEIEFSEEAEERRENGARIGGRDHAVLEFDLPPSQASYDIVIKGTPTRP
ncbi:MAG: hypothetical protein WAO55_05405 [Candidatus Manganitrophaceae bacterium]